MDQHGGVKRLFILKRFVSKEVLDVGILLDLFHRLAIGETEFRFHDQASQALL